MMGMLRETDRRREMSMRSSRRAALLLLPFLLAAPALAQKAIEQHDIVVEGKTLSRSATETFVRELTPAPSGGQLGRFHDPVCPVVLGLPEAEKKLVEARLRQVAAAIRIEVAPKRCAPNLYVLVNRDKREVLDGLRRQFPRLIAGVPPSLRKRLAETPGPVAAWQVVDLVGSDGMPLSYARMTPDGDPVRVSHTIGSPSRISALTKPYFVTSVLVVESAALGGVTTRQLADYAAMRTLAPTDTTREIRLPARSILTLFEPGLKPEAAPESVTWWDVKFLESLYAFDNEVPATAERDVMSRYMAEQLAKVPPERR
jgi:hypothetical protein